MRISDNGINALNSYRAIKANTPEAEKALSEMSSLFSKAAVDETSVKQFTEASVPKDISSGSVENLDMALQMLATTRGNILAGGAQALQAQTRMLGDEAMQLLTEE